MPVIRSFFDDSAPLSLPSTSRDSNGNGGWQWNTVTISIIAFLAGSVLVAFLAMLLARPKRWNTRKKEKKGKELHNSPILQPRSSDSRVGIPVRVSVGGDHDDRLEFKLKPRPLEPIHNPRRLEVLPEKQETPVYVLKLGTRMA